MDVLVDAVKYAKYPGAFVVLVAVFIALYKLYTEQTARKHRESKDHLESMIAVISAHNLQKNDYVVEELAYFTYKVPLRYELIQLLLSLEFPSSAFRDYVDGRPCIEVLPDFSGFIYKRVYTTECRRELRKFWGTLGYWMFALLGFSSGLIGLAICVQSTSQVMVLTGISYLTFAFAAGALCWLSLDVYVSVLAAERLHSAKRKHLH